MAGHPAKRGKELLVRSELPLAPDVIGEEDASKQGTANEAPQVILTRS